MDEKIKEALEAIMDRARQTTPGSEQTLTVYECNKCLDSTWITHVDEEGRKISERCSCWPAKQARMLLAASGLSNFVDSCTFDGFVVKTKIQKVIKETAAKYLDTLLELRGTSKKKPWLYIGGNPGSGKTHICTAVCGELLRNGIGVKYMQWTNEIRKLKFESGDSYEEKVYDYIKPSVLYIDDFLKQKYTPNPVFTDADIRAAFSILDGRYSLDKPTIISSEWDLTEHLLGVDEAVFSRVYEKCRDYTVLIERDQSNNYRLTR